MEGGDDDMCGGLFGPETPDVASPQGAAAAAAAPPRAPLAVPRSRAGPGTPGSAGDSRPPVVLTQGTAHHSLWGNMLWNAARYLSRRLDDGTIAVRGRSVLEVGAGIGVPSVFAALNGARCVVATDYPDEALLGVLRENIATAAALVAADRAAASAAPTEDSGEGDASAAARAAKPPPPPVLAAEGLLWGSDPHAAAALQHNGGSGFDVLFLSDVVFNHACHRALLATVSRCLARDRGAVAYVVFSHHRAHKVAADLAFFDLCPAFGLAASKVDEDASFPLLFPNDPGAASVRGPVHCYELRHVFDEAGAPLEAAAFDLVVHGTGFTESFLAAAAARSGLRVLQCDAAAGYGGAFATFGARAFAAEAAAQLGPDANVVVYRACFPLKPSPHTGTTPTSATAPPMTGTEDSSDTAAPPAFRARTEREWHEILVDTLPLPYLSAGDTVDCLVESNSLSYLAFQNVDRLLTLSLRATTTAASDAAGPFVDGALALVPLSRGAAFKACASWLSPMEARALTRFVKDVVPDAPPTPTANETPATATETAATTAAAAAATPGAPVLSFGDALRSKYRLSERTAGALTLHGFLADATDPRLSATDGLAAVRTFLRSVGRFGGASPFIVSRYGCTEVAQNLSRVAAVWGGVCVLRRGAVRVRADDRTAPGCAVTLSNGQEVQAKFFAAAGDAMRNPPGSGAASSATASASRPVAVSRVVLVLPERALLSWPVVEAACDDAPPDDGDSDATAAEAAQRAEFPALEAVCVVSCPDARRFATPGTPGSEGPPRPVAVLLVQASGGSCVAPPGGSVCHFSADAASLPQDALARFVRATFFAAPDGAAPDVSSPSEGRIRRLRDADVALHCAFTVDARSVAARSAANSDKGIDVSVAAEAEEEAEAEGGDAAAVAAVLPLATLFSGLDDGAYCREAHRAYDALFARRVRAAAAWHGSDSAEAKAAAAPMAFFARVPSAPGGSDASESGDDAGDDVDAGVEVAVAVEMGVE